MNPVFYALDMNRTKTLTQKLKIIVKGHGKPLVILHGWGMNSHVWQPVKDKLEENFTVYWIDLPGHGINRDITPLELNHTTDTIARLIPDDAILLGWSLGGLIAQNIALRYVNKVAQLIIVASSPSFVQHDDWKHAMQANTLDSFIENLKNDFTMTLKRFISLQFMGIKGVKQQVKMLNDELLDCPPAQQALSEGLEILKTANFHRQPLTLKTHWILGEQDRLIPASVAEALSKNTNSSVVIIDKAGHAPFISHPNEFMKSILDNV